MYVQCFLCFPTSGPGLQHGGMRYRCQVTLTIFPSHSYHRFALVFRVVPSFLAPGGKTEVGAKGVGSVGTLKSLIRRVLGVFRGGVLSAGGSGGSMCDQDHDAGARDGCEGVTPQGSGGEGEVEERASGRVPRGGSSATLGTSMQVGVAVQQVLLLD